MTAPLASRRSFITGLVSLVAAPAIVRAGSLMPVRVMFEPVTEMRFTSYGRGPAMYALPMMEAEMAAIRERIDRAFLQPSIDAIWRHLHR